MSWNNSLEYAKFYKEQNKLIGQYRKAGMKNKQIRKMFRFDLLAFNKKRSFVSHNVCLTENSANNDEDFTVFIDSACTVFNEEFIISDRFGWVESIDNIALVKKLKSLAQSDIELLTLIIFEGYTQREIAEMKGVTHTAIGKKYRKIKNILKKL